MGKNSIVAINNQADSSTLELFFLDIIQDTFDWFTGYSSPVQDVIDKVQFYKPSLIKITIDSEGGDLAKALAIYNFLKRYDAKVEVEIIGLAASAVTVIAMAASKGKLRIAKNAFMMIHDASGGLVGTSDELRAFADVVDMYTNQMQDIYSQRTGKPIADIKGLMANGDYWMTGDQAVEQGFADQTFNDTANAGMIAAHLDFAAYKNIPAQIRAQLDKVPPKAGDDSLTTFIHNQFTEMKTFFANITAAIRGTKPAEGKPIQEAIADAVQQPFEKLGEEMETTITNKVNDTVKGDAGKEAITAQVAAYLATDAGKALLNAQLKPLVDAATTDLAQELENIKGKATGGAAGEGGDGVKPKFTGSWS
jgi:ATP-dependent protease ClpP protease subunit